MRTCYGHIAGKIGVKFTEALLENDYLKEKEECYKLTQNGKNWLKKLEWRQKKVCILNLFQNI